MTAAMVGSRVPRDRSPDGERHNTAVRTSVRQRQDVRIQRRVAYWKSAKLIKMKGEIRWCVAWSHAARFPIHVLHQALSGASNRQESRECAAQFLPRYGTLPGNKGGEEGIVANGKV